MKVEENMKVFFIWLMVDSCPGQASLLHSFKELEVFFCAASGPLLFLPPICCRDVEKMTNGDQQRKKKSFSEFSKNSLNVCSWKSLVEKTFLYLNLDFQMY